ncbi:hypothetical protein CDL15_Pgr027370 [Punica granatum]|uniref:Cellulose synthase n=1 Tax=Punica granatum TaxID=22663 RepID=A0A218Y0S5_PUNGR|nr:hypothetical protein CDL15_Pgr027370 [Punica granatum]
MMDPVGPSCGVCGELVGLNDKGGVFVPCPGCKFLICNACMDAEIKEGREICLCCGHPYGNPMAKTDNRTPENLSTPAPYMDNPRQDVRVDARHVTNMPTVDNKGKDETEKAIWKNRLESWKDKKNPRKTAPDETKTESETPLEQEMEEKQSEDAAELLSTVVPLPPGKIKPYRVVMILRLIILIPFFYYRLTNPVDNAFGLWLTSVISDPFTEAPLITANTVLSILAVDYPVDKVSCYVSDDGASMLTFDSLVETANFARKWIPFCKKFSVEPRAPEFYFSHKVDYLKDKILPSTVKERRAMKREYDEFKVRINALVAKAQKTPAEGWTMKDGTPWPGNNSRNHTGMIQVFLGHSGAHDVEGNELPRLIYVAREKRPDYRDHKKAGAENALVRVSGVLTNAPYILNLDCDHYVNNSKAVREAMCFLMDPQMGKDVCFVQFPQRFVGINRYANRNTVFFDVNMKGLDGIQGPVYVGTGCVFNRQALYGYGPPGMPPLPNSSPMSLLRAFLCSRFRTKKPTKDLSEVLRDAKREDLNAAIFNLRDIENYDENERSMLMSKKSLEKTFGSSSVFIESTLMENGRVAESASAYALIREAIHVISCGYEDKTEWGREIGWIYGSVTEDILTGFKMHCRGWRSIYYMPPGPAFKGSTPNNLSDRLNQVLRWALGSVEIFLSKHCPLWYGFSAGRLQWLQRVAYVNTIVYPFTSIPLVAYCSIPAICLLTGKFIIPSLSNLASLVFLGLFLSIIVTSVMEMWWSSVNIVEWWHNEQFWVIGGVSAHLFAVFQGLVNMLGGFKTDFRVTVKATEGTELGDEHYSFKWTAILIPPTTLLVANIVGIVAGFSDAMNKGYGAWGVLFGKVFFAVWVILHLVPFLKGLTGRQGRIPTIIILWSVLLASVFSLIWVKLETFVTSVEPSTIAPTCISIDC